jgi:hypothetical protein
MLCGHTHNQEINNYIIEMDINLTLFSKSGYVNDKRKSKIFTYVSMGLQYSQHCFLFLIQLLQHTFSSLTYTLGSPKKNLGGGAALNPTKSSPDTVSPAKATFQCLKEPSPKYKTTSQQKRKYFYDLELTCGGRGAGRSHCPPEIFGEKKY